MVDPCAQYQRCEGLGIARVIARNGRVEHAVRVIADDFGAQLDMGPGCFNGHDCHWIGVAPAQWLAISTCNRRDWQGRLRAALAGVAAVSDQSAGYVVYSITGERARERLQDGTGVNFSSDHSLAGQAITANLGRINVVCWRPFETLVYNVAVFRSLSNDFEIWLQRNMLERSDADR